MDADAVFVCAQVFDTQGIVDIFGSHVVHREGSNGGGVKSIIGETVVGVAALDVVEQAQDGTFCVEAADRTVQFGEFQTVLVIFFIINYFGPAVHAPGRLGPDKAGGTLVQTLKADTPTGHSVGTRELKNTVNHV